MKYQCNSIATTFQNNIADKTSIAKRLKTLLLKKMAICFLFLGSFYSAQASHVIGGDLTYEFISNNGTTSTYKIVLKYFRDCAGIALGNTAIVTITNSSINSNQSLTLTRTSSTDKSILCPGQVSRCASTSGVLGSFEEHIYQSNVTLAHNANPYLIRLSLCCRANGITNISNPGSVEQYLSTSLTNDGILNNSSPKFLSAPSGRFCTNQSQSLSLAAFDADGDALVYSFVPARGATGTNVPYVAGFSATSPFSNSAISLDANTGLLQCTPTVASQRAVVAVKAEEFRNGIKIGEITREFEISTTACGSNASPVIQSIGNITASVGNPICVPIIATDADAAQSLTISVSSGIFPPATLVVDSQGSGYKRSIFCFTPTGADLGNTYSVIINVLDNFCPPFPGSSSSSFNITVPNCTTSISSSATPATCGVNDGTATASIVGGTAPYSYNWTGPNGFISALQSISNLAAGSYTINTVDGNNCAASAVVAVAGAVSSINQNATIVNTNCGLNNGSISLSPSDGTAPYTFSLNNGTPQTNASFSSLSQGTYTINMQDATGCNKVNIYTVVATADNTAPTVTCSNITIALDDHGHVGISNNEVAIATDDCSAVSFLLSKTHFECSDTGKNFVTVTASDASGNTNSCVAEVTVIDDMDPEIECNNVSVPLVNGVSVITEANLIAMVLDHTHEACSSNNFAISTFTFSCANRGLNFVTLSETDNSGNVGTCVAEITVVDSSPPFCCDISNNSILYPSVANAFGGSTNEVILDNCNTILNTPTLVPAGKTLRFRTGGTYTNTSTLTNHGTIIIEAGSSFINNGTYQGSGTFNGTLINNGTVSPGSQP